MFRWEENIWLFGLWGLIPLVLIGLGGLYLNARLRKKIGNEKIIQRLLPGRINWMPQVMLWLTITAFASLFIAMANPQWGTRKGPARIKSADAFILFDISQSMLVGDMAPDRLSRAKKAALDLVDILKGDRTGLILFAGNAWLQMPLTNDYAAASLFIQAADPKLAPTQGTAISDAIRLAEQSFDPESQNFRSIFIISDGEDHEEGLQEDIERLSSAGIPVFCLGIGTEQGGFIPVNYQGRADYKRDESGNFIRSVFQPEALQGIAEQTGGEYFSINKELDWKDDMKAAIERLERREVEQRSFTEFESYYTLFTGIALFLIILRLVLPGQKKVELA